MKNASTMKSEIKLTYKKANIQFAIEISPPKEGDGDKSKAETLLRISVKDAAGKKGLAFTEDCSSVLADFVGGFVRWLSTLGVTASSNGGEITGSFHPDYDVHNLIKASGGVCEMIEQRFSLYQNSILA